MKYAIVFERTPSGYSAYVPDLPGCVAAAGSYEAVEKMIREAVLLHLEALRGDGDPIPEPSTSVGSVEVSVPR
ncbi:MAG: type II toxin-antitoxin system HicB family antitoxin [Gemmatimonadetes bacterium]|nr:type II toxin-antitoxin system HicB family antitoxin [Gemmatimonadota bacterium]MYB97985.1 type II toxin-antitoxin system HicB family antitoxin [Gemmatimonadota bacterium]MYI46580.1 type II toxin-antitoxin system HicB family antitoxin [Gemmatimonadota bacterium]